MTCQGFTSTLLKGVQDLGCGKRKERNKRGTLSPKKTPPRSVKFKLLLYN